MRKLNYFYRSSTLFANQLFGRPAWLTVSIFMFIPKILSVIRDDSNVFSSKIAGPDEKLSANG